MPSIARAGTGDNQELGTQHRLPWETRTQMLSQHLLPPLLCTDRPLSWKWSWNLNLGNVILHAGTPSLLTPRTDTNPYINYFLSEGFKILRNFYKKLEKNLVRSGVENFKR